MCIIYDTTQHISDTEFLIQAIDDHNLLQSCKNDCESSHA